MRLFNVVSVALALLASQALAEPIAVPNAEQSKRDIQLWARQSSPIPTSSIPDKCKSPCQAVLSSLSDTTCISSPQCLCSSKVADPLGSCLNCAYSTDKKSDVQKQLQTAADQYVQACAQAGVTVKHITISGARGLHGGAVLGSSLAAAFAGAFLAL